MQVVEPDPTSATPPTFSTCSAGSAPTRFDAWAFERELILYLEHDLNASTFTVRVVASTLADVYAASTAGLAALKGPLHGGANEAAMEMLLEIGLGRPGGELPAATRSRTGEEDYGLRPPNLQEGRPPGPAQQGACSSGSSTEKGKGDEPLPALRDAGRGACGRPRRSRRTSTSTPPRSSTRSRSRFRSTRRSSPRAGSWDGWPTTTSRLAHNKLFRPDSDLRRLERPDLRPDREALISRRRRAPRSAATSLLLEVPDEVRIALRLRLARGTSR